MPKRSNLVVKWDGNDVRIFLAATAKAWSLHAIHGAESSFRSETLDRILEWVASDPEAFAFRGFPDDVYTDVEPGAVCAVVIGFTRDGNAFFGYQGIEVFRGGIMVREEMMRILDELVRLRSEATSEEREASLSQG